MVRENLGGFQFTTALTENVLQEIARIKPTSPANSKPWMPWAVAASTVALVVLLIGSGTQYLLRFQRPYNFDATSEMTVELVEASVVSPSKQKLSLRNQIGNADIPGKRNGNPNRGAHALQVIADQSEQSEKPAIIKSRWIPMGGPEGTSGGRAGLFATSNRTLYTVAARGIYRLTEDENAWTLICESTPTDQFQMPMAERDDTLYVLTPDELLASTDEGKTWETVGPRPDGRAFELLTTDAAFYLVFEKDIFRSDDTGKSWIPMMQDLQAYITRTNNSPEISISDAVALDNIVFIGTNQGLYRLTAGIWGELAVPYQRFDATRGSWYTSLMDKFINALVVSENRLYVIAGSDFTRYSDSAEESRSLGASIRFQESLPRVFRSTDFGDSWMDISPSEDKAWIALPPTEVNSPLRWLSGLQLVAVGETLVVMGNHLHMRSTDEGDTWVNLEIGDYHSMSQSIFPVVALDENNFYTSDISGIARSTDSGISWAPFTKGMVNSHVQSLILVGETVYALTAEEVVKSIDRGESWESVPVAGTITFPLDYQRTLWTEKKYPVQTLLTHAKIGKSDDTLYVISNSASNVGFRYLSAGGNRLVSSKGIPDFGEDSLSGEWLKKFEEARKISPDMMDEISRQRTADTPNIIEEQRTNGGFTMDGETLFMEFRKKLFRWRKGEAQWFNTGLMDNTERAPGADTSKGLTLAASQNTVYAGKRGGSLFQSLDGGENWKEITADLPFTFAYFEEIIFAGATVYVVTDQGAMNSHDGINWHALTDTDGNRPLIARIAVDGDKIYGVGNQGVYRINTDTDTWIQMASEIPYKVTAFAVDHGIFYIGTRHRGVLRLQLNQPYN